MRLIFAVKSLKYGIKIMFGYHNELLGGACHASSYD